MSSISKTGKISLALFAVVIFSLCFAKFTFASDISAQKVIELANADRKEKGIGELIENEKLNQAAADKANDMVVDGYFSHTAPDGATPWRWIENEKYDYNYAGENLAMDFVSVEKMNQAWLASPTHRANIVNEKYKDIGVAVKEGTINGHPTTIVVQIFGSGDKSAPEQTVSKIISEKIESGKKKKIPELPIEGTSNLISIFPVISSPQAGEKISRKEFAVIGRAKSGSNVNIFDRGELIANAAADGEGWFRTDTKRFADGEHVLKVESAQPLVMVRENESFSSPEVSFSIDTIKPEIKYQLLTGKSENEIVVNLSAGKPDCVFQVGKEKISADPTKSARASVKKDKLSIPLIVEDEAGNKAFYEIDLFSFFQREENFDIVRELASSLSPKEFFAAESGQAAVQKNLGIVSHQIQLSQAVR